MIRYLESSKTWLLDGKIAYSLGLSPSGLLVHTYFGAPLPMDSDYPLPCDFGTEIPFSGRIENSGEEFPSWSGFRFFEPCLKASFSDGTRDLRLAFSDYEIHATELTIVLQDSGRSVEVALLYRIDTECGVIARSARITNFGSIPIALEQALSGVLTLPYSADYRLTYLSGRWGAETQLNRMMVGSGTHLLESRHGITGHTNNPWCALDPEGVSTEEYGPVYAVNLAYSGNWKSVVQRTPAGLLRVSAGIHDFDFSRELPPGGSFTTPEMLLTYSNEGFGGASNNMHSHIRRNVLPREHRFTTRPVLYNSWEATTFDVTAENQIKLAELAAGIGVELFVIDDGWFGTRNSDRAGLGDWFVNRDKFPQGIEAVARRVEELGMSFGLWVEPEMVNPDSDLYRLHPEWVYRFPGREPLQMRNQLVLNLGRQDVQEFIFNFMDRLLSTIPIAFIKWDMNRALTDTGDSTLPVSRQKEAWHRHVEGLYHTVERIRAKHPRVLFEDCAGGGGRIDAGILRYYDQAWISDNTDGFDRLLIQEGYSFAYPSNTMVAWVTARQSIVGGRSLPLVYRFHSAMNGVLGIGDDIGTWSDSELAEARQLVGEYKVIRRTIQFGRLYRILSPRSDTVAASLYVAEDLTEAVLFAFLNRNHFRNLLPVLRLPGLDPDRQYVVELGREQTKLLSGGALRHVGIRLDMDHEYDSRLIRIHAT